jgi:oxaloacetate decarboxylase alpha subunit
VFDAMNDPRNLETAIKAVLENDRHAQGTISYTLSPVHNLQLWLDLAKQIEDMGAHSLCIKDMAGLLNPFTAYELVTNLKQTVDIPIQMHSHATTGLSTATILKCVEAGVDIVDTAISSMSMTYGHSPTETVVSIFENTDHDTGLNMTLLEEIAAYFREVRKKYAAFEGSLRGTDSRILVAQVPGGMLTNMENQLREQNATDRMDEVLREIPRVRKDLGYIPLVTPTSQIVGTQAVMNVLSGERYKAVTAETAGVLKGQYGAAPAPFYQALQEKVLDGEQPITCRPADLLEPEMDKLTGELIELADEQSIQLEQGEQLVDDVLTYALFPQVGLKFLKNRGNPDAFEPAPTLESARQATASTGGMETYTISVNGEAYVVQVNEGGDISQINTASPSSSAAPVASHGEPVTAPLSGTVWKIEVSPGQDVAEGQVLVILEAMKMETQIVASHAGKVSSILVKQGDAVKVGDTLVTIA